MATLALYLSYLMSKGCHAVDIRDVLDDYATYEAFSAYVKANEPVDVTPVWRLSDEAKAEIKAGRKITAIKIIRDETNLGLFEAKCIADGYMSRDVGNTLSLGKSHDYANSAVSAHNDGRHRYPSDFAGMCQSCDKQIDADAAALNRLREKLTGSEEPPF